MTTTSRRSILAAALSAPFGLAAAPAEDYPAATPATPATPEELELYYAFLWIEFRALADEMGVSMCDAWVMHQAGGHEAVRRLFGHMRPSQRAATMLRFAGERREMAGR